MKALKLIKRSDFAAPATMAVHQRRATSAPSAVRITFMALPTPPLERAAAVIACNTSESGRSAVKAFAKPVCRYTFELN